VIHAYTVQHIQHIEKSFAPYDRAMLDARALCGSCTSFVLEWAAAGKPRHGLEHQLMCRTRAEFKLALRLDKAIKEQFVRSL